MRRLFYAAVLTGCLAACGSAHSRSTTGAGTGSDTTAQLTVPATSTTASTTTTTRAPTRRPSPRPRHITVGITVLHLVDPARQMSVAGRSVPRAFDVIVRYPVGLPGRFPLIVFGHGFAVSPAPYSGLLDAWARAGYVVAAPVFPLENENAPGGPDERDLVNQPRDMSLVISSLLTPGSAAAARLSARIDVRHVAVAGQSDGGDTALAAAYDPSVRDPRVGAAIILSGAEDPFAPSFAMPRHGPPLLAIQGTADTINPPSLTYSFFAAAPAPKYLLKVLGAGHIPPYTEPGSEFTAVEHMTLAFLNHYFKGRSPGFQRYLAAGSAGPDTVLTADP